MDNATSSDGRKSAIVSVPVKGVASEEKTSNESNDNTPPGEQKVAAVAPQVGETVNQPAVESGTSEPTTTTTTTKKKKKKKQSYKNMMASMMKEKDADMDKDTGITKVTGGGTFSKVDKI